jgi:hypothetical protein
MRHPNRLWSLCQFCNGNGCRYCKNQGEHTNEYDRTQQEPDDHPA